jgi:hypothetical protein
MRSALLAAGSVLLLDHGYDLTATRIDQLNVFARQLDVVVSLAAALNALHGDDRVSTRRSGTARSRWSHGQED